MCFISIKKFYVIIYVFYAVYAGAYSLFFSRGVLAATFGKLYFYVIFEFLSHGLGFI